MENNINKNETSKELLKIVENTNFKGYEQHFLKNSNGDYNHKQNFFIWKKKDKKEYIRVVLMPLDIWNEQKGFYWNIETSFKPFRYKHNHRDKANIPTLYFYFTDEMINQFKQAIEIIKQELKLN